ncbi:hypothetical protein J2125_000610 [Erwinia toletana]|uniref:Uncharacterized protein n=1 Tax=Winslowiella toletana TaxID=92490 RepID=A0ABS4P456_9GAMM|nr:hypothetical protein [Winslowiella toletana]MBP2167418.1 hypothetical protein [Winslowiella toletana]
MGKIVKTASDRAYAVALAVASKYANYNTGINDSINVSASSLRLARQRSAKRSAAELNLMFEKAFSVVMK